MRVSCNDFLFLISLVPTDFLFSPSPGCAIIETRPIGRPNSRLLKTSPMKSIFILLFFLLLFVPATAQVKTNDAIVRQIKALKSEKAVELVYDQSSNVSTIRAVTENFPDAGRAGVQAMNLAIGFMYVGREITKAPDTIMVSFWVLTKKPRFAASHNLMLNDPTGGRDLGPARYTPKPRESMEYLNFRLSRADLETMASEPGSRFKLGEADFTLTPGQRKAIADLLTISDPAR